jgi:isopentenyl phosphate kinase
MIDEVKLRTKKDEKINYMLPESLWKAWTTFEPMLAHVIQLLQCGLHTRCPICFVKLLKIWFDFYHVHVQIKHGIVPLLIGDIMCSCSPNTYILPLKKLTAHSTEQL